MEYCRKNGIILQAYSPLVKAKKLENEVIVSIAKKYGKTNAEVLIRWSLEHRCVPIPKSVHKERILENCNVFDFTLNDEDMERLNALNENIHNSWNPEAFSV